MENSKIYKDKGNNNINMIPGDLKRSPDELISNQTLVFIDAGFLSKLSRHFGKGNYLQYNIIEFAHFLAEKQNLKCKHIFYYTAPPFQGDHPAKEEIKRKERYDSFIKKLSIYKEITIREGRVQRLKIDGNTIYKQKAVDSLAIIDLMSVPIEYKNITKIILIACDSDFVPVIESLSKLGIKCILYTYYERGRDAKFSTSNELIKSVNKYVLINKEDFDRAPLHGRDKG